MILYVCVYIYGANRTCICENDWRMDYPEATRNRKLRQKCTGVKNTFILFIYEIIYLRNTRECVCRFIQKIYLKHIARVALTYSAIINTHIT